MLALRVCEQEPSGLGLPRVAAELLAPRRLVLLVML